ncbi:MAG TPA: VTT domain-containing protein [Candidatus Thalassarchaeaceae archaeon]|nr:VTT domain-containing protein [Candidatus Thalassarchaeaceae archaeon]
MGLLSMFDPVVQFLDGFGLIGLSILLFTEAIINPIPPETLFWPMLIADGTFYGSLVLTIVATSSSVLGAIIGYWIGVRGGRPLIERFASQNTVRRLEVLTERYGAGGIFIAAVSPIPYKVFGWLAGMGKMDLRLFIGAGILGRGVRFGVPAMAIGAYGEEILSALNIWTFSAIAIIGAIVVIPLFRWWEGLLDENDEANLSD